MPLSASALEWIGFSAIFSYSFLVSFHCVGMCGPLACSLLDRSRLSLWKSVVLYNIGRGLSYSCAGGLAGLASGLIVFNFPKASLVLSLAFGTIICVWASLSLMGLEKRIPSFPLRAPISAFQRVSARLPAPLAAFSLGFFTLALPCMTLHPLLFMSAAHQSPIEGASTMFAFFLGTLPAMVSATYVPSLFNRSRAFPKARKIGQFLLLLAGLITIARGLIAH